MSEPESLRENKQLLRRADELEGGLEEVVAAMPIRALKRRLEDLGANPRRLEACLEKVTWDWEGGREGGWGTRTDED